MRESWQILSGGNKVDPPGTDTSLIQTPLYYGQQFPMS